MLVTECTAKCEALPRMHRTRSSPAHRLTHNAQNAMHAGRRNCTGHTGPHTGKYRHESRRFASHVKLYRTRHTATYKARRPSNAQDMQHRLISHHAGRRHAGSAKCRARGLSKCIDTRVLLCAANSCRTSARRLISPHAAVCTQMHRPCRTSARRLISHHAAVGTQARQNSRHEGCRNASRKFPTRRPTSLCA